MEVVNMMDTVYLGTRLLDPATASMESLYTFSYLLQFSQLRELRGRLPHPFPPQVFDEWSRSHPQEGLQLLNQWETLKCMFGQRGGEGGGGGGK